MPTVKKGPNAAAIFVMAMLIQEQEMASAKTPAMTIPSAAQAIPVMKAMRAKKLKVLRLNMPYKILIKTECTTIESLTFYDVPDCMGSPLS
tara:strand:- start:91 stop:363 length:273 start_codon:yes stop_codon:yes gene_type:complete